MPRTGSKFKNFAILKLMLVTNPTILNKMASLKSRKNDFQFFAKPNQQKFNIVTACKSHEKCFTIQPIERCSLTNWHMLNTMAFVKNSKK